jgi:hypothetical protein
LRKEDAKEGLRKICNMTMVILSPTKRMFLWNILKLRQKYIEWNTRGSVPLLWKQFGPYRESWDKYVSDTNMTCMTHKRTHRKLDNIPESMVKIL